MKAYKAWMPLIQIGVGWKVKRKMNAVHKTLSEKVLKLQSYAHLPHVQQKPNFKITFI